MHTLKGSNGFTLVEVLVVLSVLAMLAPLAIPDLRYKVQQTRINALATETGVLSIAILNSFDDNSVWPGGPVCANAITALSTSTPAYLSDVDGTNVFNNSITTSCTLNEFTITQNVNPLFIQEAVQTLGATSIVNAVAGTIRTTIPRSGSSAGHDALLPRDGSRPMIGDLDLGANDIVNVGDIDATNVNSSGNITAGGQITSPIIYDSNNSAYYTDQSGTSIHNTQRNNTTETSSLVMRGAVSVGSTCTGRQINVDSTGNVVSCVSGLWSVSSTSIGPGLQQAVTRGVVSMQIYFDTLGVYRSYIGNYTHCLPESEIFRNHSGVAPTGGHIAGYPQQGRDGIQKIGASWYFYYYIGNSAGNEGYSFYVSQYYACYQ
jgi:prepilin-type N-terminal cleavage/methylation domain-containing protein